MFVDTLTNATSYDVCRATENKALMTPLRDIAQETRTTIVVLVHLSKEGQVLGRRLKGIIRTLAHLNCPDPEQSERLKLSVTKSFAKKPPALGVTMTDTCNNYDHEPPHAPEPKRGGRPPVARLKAEKLIVDALTSKSPQIANDLRRQWEATGGVGSTFWRAVTELEQVGKLRTTGGTGTGQLVELHLIRAEPDATPDNPS